MLRDVLKTPRQAVRLYNQVFFEYSNLINRVNYVDFLALKILWLCYPAVYTYLSSNQDIWGYSYFSNDLKKDFYSQKINQLTKNYDNDNDKQSIKNILSLIIPEFEQYLGLRITSFDLNLVAINKGSGHFLTDR